MKAFTDTEGRLWSIRGSLGAFERVKTLTGVDMLDLPTTQNCLKEINNVFTLGRVLYAMCQDQVESRGLTPEQFADGFNADTLHEASNALLDEVVFFCRKDLRPALQMALDKARQADAMVVETMQLRVHHMEKEMDLVIENLLTSTSSATSLPASSESTPENGHSEGSSGRPQPSRKRRGATPQPS